jgi:hypothetical protein
VRRLSIALLLCATSCGSSESSTPTETNDSSAIDTATTANDALVEEVALEDSTAPSDVATDTLTMGDAIVFGAYPAGPYGNKLGDVVANLAWEGYVSPLADAIASTKPYVTTSLDQLRRDAKKGYALVHVSEFY